MKKEKIYKTQFKKRMFFIILGSLSIWYGIKLYINQWSYLYGVPVAKWTGVIIALFGVIILLYGLIKKDIPKDYDENFVMCVSCLNSFYVQEISNNICPKCNGNVEDLGGFYVRHPELKK
jgi:hypothetical protein